jgi:3',5'-cyclic AMP phosphodiesterase CpdA
MWPAVDLGKVAALPHTHMNPCPPGRDGARRRPIVMPSKLPTDTTSIRIAAIGDVHLRHEVPSQLADDLATIATRADLLVVAGDFTDGGRLPEVQLTARWLQSIPVPKIAVLGNHDRRCLRRATLRELLGTAGVHLLDGDAVTLSLADGRRVGFAGVGGYGGGFWPEEGPAIFSARLSKAIAVRARREAMRLETALTDLSAAAPEITVVVMHYAPTTTTLGDEPSRKHWMLGNSLLGSVVDRYRVDLVVHGHAHLGNHVGQTPGGVPVRNVAAQVVGRPVVYEVAPGRVVRCLSAGSVTNRSAVGSLTA